MTEDVLSMVDMSHWHEIRDLRRFASRDWRVWVAENFATPLDPVEILATAVLEAGDE